jgi:anti-sigma regulatory factor (Ser/Thr protein kinase)
VTPFQRRLTVHREEVLATLEDVQEFLSGCGLTPRTRNAVELAAEELLSNVSKYSYPAGAPGEAKLVIEVRTEGVRLELADSGRPFDPTVDAPPPPPAEDLAPGGRGLHLVRSLSRFLSYRRDGSRNVTVVEFPGL